MSPLPIRYLSLVEHLGWVVPNPGLIQVHTLRPKVLYNGSKPWYIKIMYLNCKPITLVRNSSLALARDELRKKVKSRLLDADKVILIDWVQYIGLVHQSNHQIRFLVVHHSNLLVRRGFLVLALIVRQSF